MRFDLGTMDLDERSLPFGLLVFCVTLEFSRRHGNLKPKRFDFCIEYKQIDRTSPFHYQWLRLFSLLEEIGIESTVAFFNVFQYILPYLQTTKHIHWIMIFFVNRGYLIYIYIFFFQCKIEFYFTEWKPKAVFSWIAVATKYNLWCSWVK